MSLSNKQMNRISGENGSGGGGDSPPHPLTTEESVCLVINGAQQANGHSIKTTAPRVQQNGLYYPRPFKCKAVFDFDSNEPSELAFKQNDIIIVTDSSDANNWVRKCLT